MSLWHQGGYLEVSQAEQEATSTDKPISNHPKNISEKGYRCVCLNARSIVNKKNELNIMVEDIDPHIIGITESWANIDITDAELGLTGYVMFRKDRIGRRGGGVILYVKESIQAYEIKINYWISLPKSNQGRKCIRYSFVITKRISGQCKNI